MLGPRTETPRVPAQAARVTRGVRRKMDDTVPLAYADGRASSNGASMAEQTVAALRTSAHPAVPALRHQRVSRLRSSRLIHRRIRRTRIGHPVIRRIVDSVTASRSSKHQTDTHNRRQQHRNPFLPRFHCELPLSGFGLCLMDKRLYTPAYNNLSVSGMKR